MISYSLLNPFAAGLVSGKEDDGLAHVVDTLDSAFVG